MNECENCGCKVYGGACVNCHELVYIADQHRELGTYGACSDEFKDAVMEMEIEIGMRQPCTK